MNLWLIILHFGCINAAIWYGKTYYNFILDVSKLTGSSKVIEGTSEISCSQLVSSFEETYCFKDSNCYLLNLDVKTLQTTPVSNPVKCFVGQTILVSTNRKIEIRIFKDYRIVLNFKFITEECKDSCDMSPTCSIVSFRPDGSKIACKREAENYEQLNPLATDYYCSKGITTRPFSLKTYAN